MKKVTAVLLSLAMLLSLAACGGGQAPTTAAPEPTAATQEATTPAPTTPEPTTPAATTPAPTTTEPTTAEPAPAVISYQEFLEAPLQTEVTIQATIQLSAYNGEYGTANMFLADPDGAYYIYRLPVAKADVAKMQPGTVLRVKGFKAEWEGEVEIIDAGYEIVKDGESYLAEAENVTMHLETERMAEFMNRRIALTNGMVVPSKSEAGEELPFLYSWNGTGQKGDDIYFNVAFGNKTSTLVVESDEFGPDSELYQKAQKLSVGDVISLEAFLYWYEGPQPHVAQFNTPMAGNSGEAMTYMDYQQAELDSEVHVEAYIQSVAYNAESGTANLFLEDLFGGYYVYRMNVTDEEAAQLIPGRRLAVSGFKIDWEGEQEITDGKFTAMDDYFFSWPMDITPLMGNEESLRGRMNSRIRIASAKLAPSLDAEEKEVPFLYKWNGSGVEGDDLYFSISVRNQTYVVTVESDECPAGSEVYEAVKKLKIGDSIDLEGFLYWYEGPQPHIYSVKEAQAPAVEVMDYFEFLKAPLQSEVVIESNVQGIAYNEEEGTVSLFLAGIEQDLHGYYVYNMAVTPEEAEALTIGKRILVKGFKAEWSGLLEITDATFEALEGEYISKARDVSLLMDQGDLLALAMNSRIALPRAILAPSLDAEEKEVPFLYKWNGSGTEGDDLYFNVLLMGKVFTVLVESDEYGPDSEVYKTVQGLKIGDAFDLEGFLYWYNGPQPHIYSIKTEAYAKQSEEAMSFGSYVAAEVDAEVTVEGFVQLTTSYWEEDGQGKISLYLHDRAGAYYVYNMPVTQEEAEALVPGTLIRVKGFKGEWSELPEIIDPSFEILESEEEFKAEPLEGEGNLILFGDREKTDMRYLIASPLSLLEMVVEPSYTEEGEARPFLYKWNGSGEEGDDIYFNVSFYGETIQVTVETDEFDKDSEVYQAAQALKIGDIIDLEGFLYWYNGPQPHISKIDGAEYRKSEGAMNHYEYMAAELQEKVTIDAYVQQIARVEKDGEWTVNLFLDDIAGGYYVYGMPVQEEEASSLGEGDRLVITGYKVEWNGEIEILDVEKWEVIEENYYAPRTIDMTKTIGDPQACEAVMNRRFLLDQAVVAASKDAEGNEKPFLYKWNGSGEEGDDIYFSVQVGETLLTLVVETDEISPENELYQTVQTLKVGDTVKLLAFMYFYEGPQPHLYMIEIAEQESPAE